MSETRVLVPVACYNAESFLPETIDSIRAQTSQDFDCVIVDDGSTDRSAEIAEEAARKDRRIRVLRKENGGTATARNAAIEAFADHALVLPLDADDVFYPDYVELARDAMLSNPKLRIVYGKAELFGEETGPWLLPPYTPEAILHRNVIYCSGMYRRESWKKAGGYQSHMKGLEDWDLWLGILEHDPGEVLCMDKLVFRYRIRAGSVTQDLKSVDRERMAIEDRILFRHRDLFVATMGPIHRNYIDYQRMKSNPEFRAAFYFISQLQKLGVSPVGTLKPYFDRFRTLLSSMSADSPRP